MDKKAQSSPPPAKSESDVKYPVLPASTTFRQAVDDVEKESSEITRILEDADQAITQYHAAVDARNVSDGKTKDAKDAKGGVAARAAATREVWTEKEFPGRVPRYVIHLDRADRWFKAVADHKHLFHHAEKYLSDQFPDSARYVKPIAEWVMKKLAELNLVLYADELKEISRQSGMPLGKLVLLQLAYEAAASCTSIVAPCDQTQRPLHARTMDWDTDFLQKFTIEVDYRVADRTMCLGVTWVGYVGLLTGLKPGVCSASVNFRSLGGSLLTNLRKGIMSAFPIGFLIRSALVGDGHTGHSGHTGDDGGLDTFDQIAEALAEQPIMAPCYITLCGTKPNQGVVITRNRDTEEKRFTLGQNGQHANAPCFQTNIDRWIPDRHITDNVIWSVERRHVGEFFFESNRVRNEDHMWSLLHTSPIWNREIIYACVMDPAKGTLATRVPGVNIPEDVKATSDRFGITALNFFPTTDPKSGCNKSSLCTYKCEEDEKPKRLPPHVVWFLAAVVVLLAALPKRLPTHVVWFLAAVGVLLAGLFWRK